MDCKECNDTINVTMATYLSQHVSYSDDAIIRKEDLVNDRNQWIIHRKEEIAQKKRENFQTIIREITEKVIHTSRYEGKTCITYSVGVARGGGFYGETKVNAKYLPNTDLIIQRLKEKFPDSKVGVVKLPESQDPDTYIRRIYVDWS